MCHSLVADENTSKTFIFTNWPSVAYEPGTIAIYVEGLICLYFKISDWPIEVLNESRRTHEWSFSFESAVNHFRSFFVVSNCKVPWCSRRRSSLYLGLYPGNKVVHLSLQANQLITTKGLYTWRYLQNLDCSNNHLSQIQELECCPLLRILKLKGNNLRKVFMFSGFIKTIANDYKKTKKL